MLSMQEAVRGLPQRHQILFASLWPAVPVRGEWLLERSPTMEGKADDH